MMSLDRKIELLIAILIGLVAILEFLDTTPPIWLVPHIPIYILLIFSIIVLHNQIMEQKERIDNLKKMEKEPEEKV